VKENRAFAASTAQTSARGAATGGDPQGAGRHLVDFAQRGSPAGFARGVSFAGHLLAAAARLGRTGHLAAHLANVSGGIERTPAVKVERIVLGREFCPGEKRGSGVGKTKRGKGTKWMVAVFLWESDFTLPLPPRSGWRKKRWPRAESDGGTTAGGRDKSPCE